MVFKYKLGSKSVSFFCCCKRDQAFGLSHISGLVLELPEPNEFGSLDFSFGIIRKTEDEEFVGCIF